MRRLKHVLIAGMLFLLPLLVSAQAPLSPFGALPSTNDKSMVVFPIPDQTNQITLTPAGEAYQTGTTFPESVVVSAWKEIGTLALTDPPLAAILTKYNVHITAADGTPVFPKGSSMAFAYYSPLTIDHTKVPNTDQTDFPVLVSLTDARLKTVGNGGHVQNASGFDIRPYTDSALTTAITGFELESYDASAGTLIMWVKIASLSHTADTVFYLAYGDSGLSTDGSSTGTWDSYYAAVYHLGDGITVSGKDSTSHGVDLTNFSATAHAGLLAGGSASFSGATEWMTSSSTISFVSTDHVTFQAWIKSDVLDSTYREIIRMNGVGGLFFLQGAANKWSFTASGGSYDHANAPAGTTTGNHLLVGVFDGTNTQMYIDGAAAGTSYADTPMPNATAAVVVGAVDAAGSGQFWTGLIDEARISKIDRSADWIATEYHNQNSPGTFETLGTEVPVGGGGISIPALNPNMRGGFQSSMRGGFVN